MSLRVGIVQIASGEDKQENLKKAKKMVLQAADKGAELILLPELFNYLPETITADAYRKKAERLDGPTIGMLKDIAATRNIAIVSGSIAEEEEGGKIYNTSFFIGSSGIIAGYRKIHLFKFGDIDETTVFEGGVKPVVAEGKGFKIGLTTCFDLRFPELYRSEALMGAGIIANVAAFLESTGRAHWIVLLRARSIENQVFILAANQAKSVRKGTTYYGNSAIIDPWGKIIARAGQAEELLIADLDLDQICRVRNNLSVIDSRRPNAYRL
jgi:predicted amidohydrolase